MTRRIVDLTYPIHEGMTTFPSMNHPFVEITQLGRHGIENRETRKLVLGTHTGTHCDAPRHFIPGGETVDNLPLNVLVGPAVVLDFTYVKPNQEMAVADFEKQLGERRPERLVLRYDWSDHWGKMEYYTNCPVLSEAAAHWLVERGLRLLAMDTPMPDSLQHGQGSAKDSPVHEIMLGKGVILVEYLCNLRALRNNEIELVVLPLKVQGGDGAPARCIAIEE